MSNDLGRTELSIVTNKSGGSLAQGDVVIVDGANAAAVTTTTTGSYVSGRVGVVWDLNGIASNAQGLVAFSGEVPKINLNTSASLGDIVKTHTVAKQGTPHAAPQGAGDFAQVLGTGTSPRALLFGTVQLGGGSGAPTTSEYLTTASDTTLTQEVVIPGLAGSADIAGAAGAGVAYEFDSGASPLTWSAAVDAEDVDTTVKSHLFIQDNGAAETLGTYTWSPAGAFDIRTKLSLGGEVGTSASSILVALMVADNTLANRVLTQLTFTGATDQWQVLGITYTASTYSQRGATSVIGTNEVYLRITRDGSNNVSFYYSMSGKPGSWLLIATQSFTFTVAKAGFRFFGNSLIANAAIDWIRSDV